MTRRRRRMGFRGRWRPHLGWFYLNFSNFRPTSVGIRKGELSHNFRSGKTWINTPGYGSWWFGGRTEREARDRGTGFVAALKFLFALVLIGLLVLTAAVVTLIILYHAYWS